MVPLPEISSAEVEEIQHSHTSHPVTRVQTCDTTPHTSDRVSPLDCNRYILSGNSV